ncbi:MAG: sulfatase, partial [candidate division Zixibacteria bacterium]|nr:sulfatase [candidate division Zixibacteria bacterium]
MSHPNLLFVFDDQHRYSALGANGNPVVRTPHLDRLAGEGVVLDQMLSSCPICSPYRGQLMTGRYSHANGIMDNEYLLREDQALFPQTLSDAGYRTGYVGKWHLGYPPYTQDKRYGFDYMAAYNCNHDYYNVEYYENEVGPIQIDGWAPTRETDLAIGYLERHAADPGDQPFCLMLSWGPPHWPYDQYPRKHKRYNPAEVDLPPNVPKAFAAYAREEIADYYGNISGLDDEMGRLLTAVDRLGLRNDTVVIFTSDHGDHLSSHGFGKPMDRWMHHSFRASKATPYEESVHVPFIARWPGHIAPGTRSDALVSSVDLMPTLLTLCGLSVPSGVQGNSMAHHLLGQDGPRNDSVYMQILGPGWPHRGKWVGFWRGVRDERWTYARWRGNERGPFLFDR